jgi:hypothetical protein
MVRNVAVNCFTVGCQAAPGSTDFGRLQARWTYGLDVDQSDGSVYVAIPDYLSTSSGGGPRGRVYVGRSNDLGKTWSWTQVPRLPKVGDRSQSAHKPTLAVRDGRVFVGVHGLVDVPAGTNRELGLATIGNYYSVSDDGGATFSRPLALSTTRWDLEALKSTRPSSGFTSNRAGLRDRAEFTSDGLVVYVYGDGRDARPEPDKRAGRGEIFASLISVGG